MFFCRLAKPEGRVDEIQPEGRDAMMSAYEALMLILTLALVIIGIISISKDGNTKK